MQRIIDLKKPRTGIIKTINRDGSVWVSWHNDYYWLYKLTRSDLQSKFMNENRYLCV